MLWRDEELILPKGRILIRQIPDLTVTSSGLILEKAIVKNHKGTVIISSIPEIEVGVRVLYIPGSGLKIDHKGEEARMLIESQILYVVS